MAVKRYLVLGSNVAPENHTWGFIRKSIDLYATVVFNLHSPKAGHA